MEFIKKKETPKDDWKTLTLRILGRYDDYKTAQKKCKTAIDKDNLSSLSEAAEYRRRIHKNRKRDSDTDEESEEESFINFPKYNSDNTVSSPNLAHIDLSNEAHSKTNQFTSKKIKSDTVLNEVHKNIKKQANEMKEFQRQVLRHLHSINAQIGELNEHVDSLKPNLLDNEENSHQTIVNEDSIKCIEDLPIKSKLELEEIERVLQDKQIFHDVATELSKMGGTNLRIIVKKIMCRILTPEIERDYSWEEHKGNLIFKDLILAKLVLKSARLTTKKNQDNITDHEIINAIKTWLVKAKLKTKQENEANRPVSNEVNEPVPNEAV